MATLAWMISIY